MSGGKNQVTAVHTSPESPDEPVEDVRLTVAGAAARLGVAASTLRTWARRYGLGPSGHVAGRHRRYDAADLARLETMRRLTLEGVAPADAAQLALRGEEASVPDFGDGPVPDGPVNSRVEARGDAEEEAALEEPAVVDPLTVSAAAIDGEHGRLTRMIRQVFDEHGILEGWLTAVRPAVEMLAQRPSPDRPGSDPELLLRSQTLSVLRTLADRQAPPPTSGRALIQSTARRRTDAHVLAAELSTRGVQVRVVHRRMEADGGRELVDLVMASPRTLMVILGESEVAERLVTELCGRDQEVFLIALTDAISPRPHLHRARTMPGALHEIMSLLAPVGAQSDRA